MSLSTPTLVARSSNVKMPVATCVSANGKPPATIRCVFLCGSRPLRSVHPLHQLCFLRTNRWETSVPGEVSSREYRNYDGTFTVQSDYILVPSRETHKETLTCVTTYNEEVFTDSVTLDIQCKRGGYVATGIICLPEAAKFQSCLYCVPDEPDVLVDGFDGNWYLNRENVQLSCQADANPTVSLYQWRL